MQLLKAFRIGADEFGPMTFSQTEHVVKHEDLPRTVRASTDSDRWYCQGIGRSSGELGRNALQYQSETAGLLQMMSIIEKTQRFVRFSALHFEATHDIDALGHKAKVAHHGNLAIDKGTHHVDSLAAALEFHRSRTSLQKSPGVAYGFPDTDVIAKERHIGDEQSTRLTAYYGFQMMIHHRNAHWKRVFEAKANVTYTVTDENNIYCRVRDTRRNRVVGRCHDDTPAVLLPPLQKGNCNSVDQLLRNVAHLDLSLILLFGLNSVRPKDEQQTMIWSRACRVEPLRTQRRGLRVPRLTLAEIGAPEFLFRIFTNLIGGMAAEIGLWIEGDRAATLKVGFPLMVGSEYFSHLKNVEVPRSSVPSYGAWKKIVKIGKRKRN
ncbi:hypothetical protein ACVWZ4_001363 [Bradyrhizobium sp. USDA 4472]